MARAFSTSYLSSAQALPITITSLANGASRQSSAVSNAVSEALDAIVTVRTELSAVPKGDDRCLDIYAYAAYEDVNPVYSGGAGGVDGVYSGDFSGLNYVGTIRTLDTTDPVTAGPLSIRQAFGGLLPPRWGIIIRNRSGASLSTASSDHVVQYNLILGGESDATSPAQTIAPRGVINVNIMGAHQISRASDPLPSRQGYTLLHNFTFGNSIASTADLNNAFAYRLIFSGGTANADPGAGQWQQFKDPADGVHVLGSTSLKLRAILPDNTTGFNSSNNTCVPSGLPITSGMIRTLATLDTTNNDYFIEAKMKTATGKALWPIFSVMAQDAQQQPEIRIAHWPQSTANTTRYVTDVLTALPAPVNSTADDAAGFFNPGVDTALDFHIYGLAWNKVGVQYYFDETQIEDTAVQWRHNDSTFAGPGHVVIRHAVGSTSIGGPNTTTIFPADLEIQYLRIWAKAAASTQTSVLIEAESMQLSGYAVEAGPADSNGNHIAVTPIGPVATPTETKVTIATAPVTYFVAKTGLDTNPGTAAQPWLTIQKAANTAVAGDIVQVNAGTYAETVSVQHEGTSGSPITFVANGVVTITGGFKPSTFNDNAGDPLENPNKYYRIKGFVFDGISGKAIRASTGWVLDHITVQNGGFGVNMRGNDITVQDCVFKDLNGTDAHAMVGVGGTNIRVIDTTVQRINTTNGTDPGNSAVNKFLFTTNAKINRCTFDSNHGPGMWFDTGNDGFVVSGCTFSNNSSAAGSESGNGLFIEVNGDCNGTVGPNNSFLNNAFAGLYIAESAIIEVLNNTFSGNGRDIEFKNQDRNETGTFFDPNVNSADRPPNNGHTTTYCHDIDVHDNTFSSALTTEVHGGSTVDNSTLNPYDWASPPTANIVLNKNRYNSGVKVNWVDPNTHGGITYSTIASLQSAIQWELNQGSNTGTATIIFTGTTGNYDVELAYYDESDATTAQIVVKLNGVTIATQNLNEASTSATPDASSRRVRTVATNVSVMFGDTILIQGTGSTDGAERACVDYIKFTPSTGGGGGGNTGGGTITLAPTRPFQAATLGGDPIGGNAWTLLQNYEFGKNGNIRSMDDLNLNFFFRYVYSGGTEDTLGGNREMEHYRNYPEGDPKSNHVFTDDTLQLTARVRAGATDGCFRQVMAKHTVTTSGTISMTVQTGLCWLPNDKLSVGFSQGGVIDNDAYAYGDARINSYDKNTGALVFHYTQVWGGGLTANTPVCWNHNLIESGMLRTKRTFPPPAFNEEYFFEWRVKPQRKVSSFPACWLNPELSQAVARGVAPWPPEIDCAEFPVNRTDGSRDDTTKSFHGVVVNGKTCRGSGSMTERAAGWDGTSNRFIPGWDYANDFHYICGQWGRGYVTMWTTKVDGTPLKIGKRIYNWVSDDCLDADPAHALINQAVGSNWTGPPRSAGDFPIVFHVDFFRAWKRNI